jgi:hypothetical protein
MDAITEEPEGDPYEWAADYLAARDTSYFDQAACAAEYARTGIDYWFDPENEGGHGVNNASMRLLDLLYTPAQRHRIAKRICYRCPVRARCLADALSRDEQEGIWGGLTTDERRDLSVGLTKESA